MIFTGVLPALTTPFDPELRVDHDFLARHARWQLANGCSGLVALGSLGEGATLDHAEKLAVLKTVVEAAEGKPVIASVSSLATHSAVTLAKDAEQAGCSGLMVLPPYVYTSDWREMKAHISAVLNATSLPAMLYNNPIAYKTDFLPRHISELAQAHENLLGVKESAADVRRITAIRELIEERLQICVGVDDMLVEGVAAGAVGWVAGLVNAFPAESVCLFNLASQNSPETFALYRWFLPLLRMDTVPKFVQLIKWVQDRRGVGSARVRSPRLPLAGPELSATLPVFATAMATRPQIAEVPFS